MSYRISKFILLSVLILSFGLLSSQILADESDSFNFEICESGEFDKECENLTPEKCKELLKNCLDYFDEKSAQIEEDITKTEKEKKTLENQIYILKKKIENLDYQIYQGNVMIKDLGLQIGDTQFSIDKTSLKIDESRKQLTDILRAINEEDQKSLIEILLEGNLSDFFGDLVYLENLNSKLQELLENTKDLKSYLESQEEEMSEEKEDLENLVKIQFLQKQEQAKTKKEQEYLWKLTEAEYQEQVKEKEETEKTAAEIRARIFELIGIPKAPTFGEAYELAKEVSNITEIRPALLLAVLTQESRLGKNVGQCYLTNKKTGDGIYIKTGNRALRTMSPTQVPYFLQILERLNEEKGLVRDYKETPVSCCMYRDGKPYGWGGAMGPAQFMPKTWGKYGYGERVEEITGKASDPWDIKDAFLAAALYLTDYGAGRKTYNSELNAVMHYFSGASWNSWEERYYGSSVLSIAKGYEKDIAEIEKAS